MDNTAQWPRCWFTMAEKRVHKPFPQPWLASGVWGCLRTFSLTRRCPCASVVWEAKDGLKSVKIPAPQKSYSTTLRCESQGQKKTEAIRVLQKRDIDYRGDLRPLCKQGEIAVDCTKKCSISCLSAAGTFPHQLFWLLVLFSSAFLHLSVFFYLVTSLSKHHRLRNAFHTWKL